MAEQREKLNAMRQDGIAEFATIRAEVRPEDISDVRNTRIEIRREHTAKLSERLRENFGGSYDYRSMISAEDKADTAVGEEPGEISKQAMHREYKRRHPQHRQKPQKQKHDFDMSR